MANDSKYGKNRNLWRKVYTFRRRKPIIRQLVDANTQISFSYDLQTIVRHRDFFSIETTITTSIFTPSPAPTSSLAEYDEGLIAFNNTDEESSSFNFTFSSTPDAVVLTVDPAALGDSSENVVVYGLSFSTTALTVGTSAPFSGNIRYRAVYSSTGYPTTATSSLVPASGTFTLSAGGVAVANATAYTASFDELTGVASIFYKTAWGTSNTSSVDVFLTEETVSSASATGEISAPLTNTIYFIAVE